MEQLDRFLTVKEACRLAGVSRSTLWRMQRQDKSFPQSRRISRARVGILRSELRNWLATREPVGSAHNGDSAEADR